VKPASAILRDLFSRLPAWLAGAAVFAVHAAVGVYLRKVRGVNIASDPILNNWEAFWQTLPMRFLLESPADSLLHCHSQPPMLNVVGLAVRRLAGEGRHLAATHTLQMLLGSLACAMAYALLRHLTGKPGVSFAVAVLLALAPAMFLYEAFLLYTLLIAFFLMLFLFCLVRAARGRRMRDLVACTAALNLLMLTQTSFHPMLLLPFLALGALLAGPRWRRFLAWSLLASSLTLGWYAKNQAVFGFFGASSWMGSNFWRIVSANYTREELLALRDAGVIEPAAAERGCFDRPSKFVPYGFDRTSDVPVLSQDDYNNVNMPDISRMHQRNAIRLLRHDPRHYLANVAEAYGLFCKPSFHTRPLATNAGRLPAAVRDLSLLDGRRLLARANERWGTHWTSLYQFLIPLLLLAYGGRAFWLCRFSPRSWAALLRAYPVEAALCFLVFYLTAVSILFEHGENCRFKFPIESVVVCMAVAVPFGRFWRRGALPDPDFGKGAGADDAANARQNGRL
jgi:hypothetical protein